MGVLVIKRRRGQSTTLQVGDVEVRVKLLRVKGNAGWLMFKADRDKVLILREELEGRRTPLVGVHGRLPDPAA